MARNILLHGNSIFLNGLAAWLQPQPGLTVRRQLPGNGPLSPDDFDTVIVDIYETPIPEALARFEAYPHLTLVAVDARLDTVIVLSGQVYRLHALVDVLHCMD